MIDNDNADNRNALAVALGQIIGERRKKRGWSVTDLAFKSRLHPVILQLIESGDCLPHSDDLSNVAVALGHSSCAPFFLSAWILCDLTAETSEPFASAAV